MWMIFTVWLAAKKKWLANFPPHLVSVMDFVDLNTQGSKLIKQLPSMSILLDLKPNETEPNWMKLVADGLDFHLHGHRDPSRKPQNYGHDKKWGTRNTKKPTWIPLGWIHLFILVWSEVFSESRILYFESSCEILWLSVLVVSKTPNGDPPDLVIDSHSNWNSADTYNDMI